MVLHVDKPLNGNVDETKKGELTTLYVVLRSRPLDAHAAVDRSLLVISICICCSGSGRIRHRHNGRGRCNGCDRGWCRRGYLASILRGRLCRATGPCRSHRGRAMDFTVQGHILLGRIISASLEKVSHVDLDEFLHHLGRKSTLGPDILNDLLDTFILDRLGSSTCRLIQFKCEIAGPERPAVQVVLLVSLEDLPSLFGRALDLPKEAGPFGNKSGLGGHVALRRVKLGLVYFNCCVETSVATAGVGQRDDRLDVVREMDEDGFVDVFCHIHTACHLLEICVLKTGSGVRDGDIQATCALINASHFFLLVGLGGHPASVPLPEFVIVGTCHQTPFVQELGARVRSFALFEVEILLPVRQLSLIQLSHMEVWPLDLRFVGPPFRRLCLCLGEDFKVMTVNTQPDVSFNFSFDLGTWGDMRRSRFDLGTVLGQYLGGCKLCHWSGLSHLAIPFKVPSILVHGNMDDTAKDLEDLIKGFHALLVLDILIPERMGKEV